MILVLSLVLILLISMAANLYNLGTTADPTGTNSRPSATSQTQPSTTETPQPDPKPTEQPTLPTEPDPPSTEADPPPAPDPDPGKEYIGTLYTREELEALNSTLQGYGAGFEVDSKNRPTLAADIDQQYKKYNAYFIGPDNGNIYLSFNCGYEYNNQTSAVLDILKEKNVKCVFFVNMYFVKSNPQLIQRIIDEGHTLGNHCTNHPDLPNLPLNEMVVEIMTIHDYVLDQYGYEMTLFRPPSGYFSEQMLAVVQSLGYKTVNFSFSYVDWNTDDPVDLTKKDLLISKAHSGAIYQLHTVSPTNVAILGDVIDGFRSLGFTLALYK